MGESRPAARASRGRRVIRYPSAVHTYPPCRMAHHCPCRHPEPRRCLSTRTCSPQPIVPMIDAPARGLPRTGTAVRERSGLGQASATRDGRDAAGPTPTEAAKAVAASGTRRLCRRDFRISAPAPLGVDPLTRKSGGPRLVALGDSRGGPLERPRRDAVPISLSEASCRMKFSPVVYCFGIRGSHQAAQDALLNVREGRRPLAHRGCEVESSL